MRLAWKRAAATGLDRPQGDAVNVFFAFTRCPTYQCRARGGVYREHEEAP
jgi:hypothetical protein